MKAITTTITAIPGKVAKLSVTFTETKFSVPINFNFGRPLTGDAKGSKPWRHPFTKRVAIRTPRIPAHDSRPRIQTYNEQKPNEN
jgi:hypothetical protein